MDSHVIIRDLCDVLREEFIFGQIFVTEIILELP